MPGRRWSDGLHQAVEAKEGVKVQAENITQATITIQNYFRMYEKLAGMTGTALTESEEFYRIYGLEVLPIPTHLEYRAMGETPDLIEAQSKMNMGIGIPIIIYPKTGENPLYIGSARITPMSFTGPKKPNSGLLPKKSSLCMFLGGPSWSAPLR